ncbi:HAD family hydrolase [Acinetobacter rudis]|uniref:HAD family hydrolase n=1 Tax=Acinetobacter rudis TaxID=632955 RepID=UPI003342C2D1
MSIQAVLFDLDNTLTHRGQSVSAYSQFLAQHFAASLLNIDLPKIQRIINRIDNGGYPKKELLTHPSIGASVAYALQQQLSWRAVPDFDELTKFWFDHFGRNAVAMPGAEALLQGLKQQFKLAVISNGGHATRLSILQGLGFTNYFDEIVSSELAGISKPKPEIFLQTSVKLGIAPERCLFIGDHPINDVQGALAAGMQAILLEGFHTTNQYMISNRIQQLDQIWTFLD